jgi:hypothetical protein
MLMMQIHHTTPVGPVNPIVRLWRFSERVAVRLITLHVFLFFVVLILGATLAIAGAVIELVS